LSNKNKKKKPETWSLIDTYITSGTSSDSTTVGGWNDLSPTATGAYPYPVQPTWQTGNNITTPSVNRNTPILVDGKITTLGEIIRTLRLMERILKHELAAEIIAEALNDDDEDEEDEEEE